MSTAEDASPRRWKVNAGDVRAARFRVLRDQDLGRETPSYIRRVAELRIPDDERNPR